MNKNHFLSILSFLCSSTLLFSEEKPKQFMLMSMTPGVALEQLVFIADALGTEPRYLFRQGRWGVGIISIFCDGVELDAKESNVQFDDPDFKAFEFSGGSYIYRIFLDELYFAHKVDADSATYSLYKYDLPSHFVKLEIEYKIRFANNLNGSTKKLVVYSEYEELGNRTAVH
jgi:hypothetical protein